MSWDIIADMEFLRIKFCGQNCNDTNTINRASAMSLEKTKWFITPAEICFEILFPSADEHHVVLRQNELTVLLIIISAEFDCNPSRNWYEFARVFNVIAFKHLPRSSWRVSPGTFRSSSFGCNRLSQKFWRIPLLFLSPPLIHGFLDFIAVVRLQSAVS